MRLPSVRPLVIGLVLVCAPATVAAAVASTSPVAVAAPAAGMPVGKEADFLAAMRRALVPRYSAIRDAEHAGFFRYTPEDATGAISYANLRWTSASAAEPSQLWYDRYGRLLGADYSLPAADAVPPRRFGLRPERWTHIPQHVHYVLRANGGSTVYGEADPAAFRKAGGDLAAPRAATLVRMGVTPDARRVAHVFVVPETWDAVIWIVPNPNGAFAEADPLVHPGPDARPHGM